MLQALSDELPPYDLVRSIFEILVDPCINLICLSTPWGYCFQYFDIDS